MAFPKANTVPIPELIRRGYDRAKGLGHEGMAKVRLDHQRFLAERLNLREPKTLPPPAPLDTPLVIISPEIMASLYAPEGPQQARAALMTALDGQARLVATHPWLMRSLASFQALDFDVRTVTLWTATMTVLPQWVAPGSWPDDLSPLTPVDSLTPASAATLAAALGAANEGAVTLVTDSSPLASLASQHPSLRALTV